MIGGQVLDIESEHLKPTPELVEAIHRAKTGALIRVSVVSGGVYAGATADDVARLDTFGRKAGLAFQIVDDVLDMTVDSAHLGKTAGKDLATEKATWPAVFGIEQSRARRRDLIDEAFAALAPYGTAPKGSSRLPAISSSVRTIAADLLSYPARGSPEAGTLTNRHPHRSARLLRPRSQAEPRRPRADLLRSRPAPIPTPRPRGRASGSRSP